MAIWNPEVEKVFVNLGNGRYRAYSLEPTNIIEGNRGYSAAGGIATVLGEGTANEMQQLTGLSPNQSKTVSLPEIEGYQRQAVKSEGQIADELGKVFQQMDPTGQYGQYLAEKAPALVQRAKAELQRDPRSNIIGQFWNEYRYGSSFKPPEKEKTLAGAKEATGSTQTIDPSTLPPETVVTVKSPSGETRQVQAGQAIGFEQSGWTVLSNVQQAPQSVQQATQGSSSFDFQNYSDLSEEEKQRLGWDGLDNNQRSAVYAFYKAKTATNEADKKLALDAIQQASKYADPYFKEQLRLAQDEIIRSVGSTQENALSRTEALQQHVKNLKDDLMFNKEQLTLEQQQELSSQLSQNEAELQGLQQQMAEAGLAYSSPRQQAERNLLIQQQGIAESTGRKYARLLRSEEQAAQRGIMESTRGISDVSRAAGEQLTDIARRGEAQVGSANLPAGVGSLGGITGSLENQRQQNITQLAGTIRQSGEPFNYF